MKKLAVIVICLLFAGPALAQSVGEKPGVNSLLGLSPSTADFVKEAAVSDIFEVQSSQLAAERADGPTKAFGICGRWRDRIMTGHDSGVVTTSLIAGIPRDHSRRL